MHMLKRWIPFAHANNVYDIPVDFFVKQGVKVLLSDLDNTLITYALAHPTEDCFRFVKELKDHGIELVICSNGLGRRVGPFAEELGVEARCFLRKPFAGPLKRFLKEKGWSKEEVMLVGDQIQTDVLGANGAGIRCLLTEPLGSYEPPWTKFNRLFDKPKRKKILEKHLTPEWEEIYHE